MTKPLTSAFIAALAAASPAALPAQTLLTGDHSIQGKLCAGQACTTPETFNANDSLKLNGNTVSIHFEDTSDDGLFPGRDWRLLANDGNAFSSGGEERF